MSSSPTALQPAAAPDKAPCRSPARMPRAAHLGNACRGIPARVARVPVAEAAPVQAPAEAAVVVTAPVPAVVVAAEQALGSARSPAWSSWLRRQPWTRAAPERSDGVSRRL